MNKDEHFPEQVVFDDLYEDLNEEEEKGSEDAEKLVHNYRL